MCRHPGCLTRRRRAARGGAGRAAPIEETHTADISGFAVGLGATIRNLGAKHGLGSKFALSVFRPWSDQLYFFGQLTTHLEAADSGPPATADRDRQPHHQLDAGAPVDAVTVVRAVRRGPLGSSATTSRLNLIPTDVVHVRERPAGEVHGS